MTLFRHSAIRNLQSTILLIASAFILAAPAFAGGGPPVIDNVSPDAPDNCDPVTGWRVNGSGFVSGATITLTKAGESDIEVTEIFYSSVPTILKATLPITGAAPGFWDVVVTNPDLQSDTLPAGLQITECVPPVIDSINPTRIIHPGSGPLVAGIWIHGSELPSSTPTVQPTLTLRRADWPDLTDTADQSDGPNWQFFKFDDFVDLTGAPLGFYDVIYTRPDGQSDTVVDGLEIVADPGLKIKQIGSWGGATDAIHIEQNGAQRLAYVGSGVRFLILDVTDPGNLIVLGSLMLDSVVLDVKVGDGYAYLGVSPASVPTPDTAAWFCVVDVTDPTAPFLVSAGTGGPHDPAPGSPIGGVYNNVDIYWDHSIAFVTPHNAAPQAIDISDPAAPVYHSERGGGQAPLISGNLMYALDAFSGSVWVSDMNQLDLEDPATDFHMPLGLVQIPDFAGAVNSWIGSALAGDYLYVTARISASVTYSLLFVVDFSDLTAPVHVGTWGDPTGDTFGFTGAVAISDGRLYWAGASRADAMSRSMVILDIATDPTTPTLIGEYVSDASFTEIEVVGTTAYLGDLREGFTIVDCADPANPVRVGNYYSPSWFHQGAVDGSDLYVTDSKYGLSVIDVADPRTPAFVGRHETRTDAGSTYTRSWGVVVRDDLAYLAAGRAGLQVLDVSDPAAPTLAGEFSPWPTNVSSRALTLSPGEPLVHLGVHTFSGGIAGWVVNFEVSDLANIIDVGDVFIGSGFPNTIARRPDGIAYVPYNALATVDLSDPTLPTLLGTTGPGGSEDAVLEGDVLFVASESGWGPDVGGLEIASVATPDGLPVPLAHFGSGHSNEIVSHAVAVRNGRAFLSSDGLTLYVLDVTDPTSPLALAVTGSAGSRINDLIVDGPLVYATTRGAGFGGGDAGVLIYLVYVLGDYDDNGVIDGQDADSFADCFTGPDVEPTDPTCLIFDFDEDGDVDCDDWEEFQLAWTGEGDPPNFDPCGNPPCPADFDGDGNVSAADLAQLLGAWGPCDGDCPADLSGDGVVGAFDLAMLLGSWGECA